MIVLTITLVFAAEFINTAIETLVDLVSPQQNPLAKIAKDVSAAAVLLAAGGAVILGLLLLGPPLWVRLQGIFSRRLRNTVFFKLRSNMTQTSFRFGTVGSPISTPKKPGGSAGAIQRTAELGLGAMELGWVQSVRVTEQTCAVIRAVGLEQGVLLSVHAPYFIKLKCQ